MTHITASSKPWVIVSRHPDHATEVDVINGHVGIVVLDYGASFNGDVTDPEALKGFVEGAREQVKNAPVEVREDVEDRLMTLFVNFAFDLQDESDEERQHAREVLAGMFDPE